MTAGGWHYANPAPLGLSWSAPAILPLQTCFSISFILHIPSLRLYKVCLLASLSSNEHLSCLFTPGFICELSTSTYFLTAVTLACSQGSENMLALLALLTDNSTSVRPIGFLNYAKNGKLDPGSEASGLAEGCLPQTV